ncbi:MAG: hypothetical protein ONB48_06840 [candidate division KSB1 bacterium]|nr:hypothetical protein [candidate division KSB1 bacterium]MDZ7273258.1 hypothetical protein [candidate division KSB1 bacterium]MDZ7285360.1 hypothetical protein [candidate division KSB1 bacterium]MDZ7298392.1 hypothetical protein [candidate division KSB1 bacterium]MDZ7348975.1 hypothetical protein [candidate division KSB1 bacterium]
MFTKRRQLFRSKSGKTFFGCAAALSAKFTRLPKASGLLSHENGLPRNGFFRGISVFVGGWFVFDSDTEGCIAVVLPEFCMRACSCPEEVARVKCTPAGVDRTFAGKIFYAPPLGWLGVAIKSAFRAEGAIRVQDSGCRRLFFADSAPRGENRCFASP